MHAKHTDIELITNMQIWQAPKNHTQQTVKNSIRQVTKINPPKQHNIQQSAGGHTIDIQQNDVIAQHSRGTHIGDAHAKHTNIVKVITQVIHGAFQQIPIGMPITPILQKPRFNAPRLNIPTLNIVPILQTPHAKPITAQLHIPHDTAH